jgi:CRISPR-associated endonuclease/helicase Cas3
MIKHTQCESIGGDVFVSRFCALTGNSPFPWQKELYSRFLSVDIPEVALLPTGTGKTSVMAIWLLALAECITRRTGPSLGYPRRLLWVVNRRVVVDQATDEAETLLHRLRDRGRVALDPIRAALECIASKGEKGELLAVSSLRGQLADTAEWRRDPARAAIIIGTVDMIGSRLLFSGYGAGLRTKPLHAALLGHDSLLVHDEAHLEPAFQRVLDDVRHEQQRSGEPGLRLLELSATARNSPPVTSRCILRLTGEEQAAIAKNDEPADVSLCELWRRLRAAKALRFQPVADEKQDSVVKGIVDQVKDLERRFKSSASTVLIYAREVEQVEDIFKELEKDRKRKVEKLTGTMRSWEREQLPKTAVFRRFLPEASKDATPPEMAFLVCTSAGEVGLNISADHLVCDVSTFESMVQRFGRVNRFGRRQDTEIYVVYPKEFDAKKPLHEQRERSLELLKVLTDASPRALDTLDPQKRQAAFAKEPVMLPITDILLDRWSLTTVRELPGRPPVEPYLHGIAEWDPPETHVAWREEVGLIKPELMELYPPRELLDDWPLKPHELLRDTSYRIFKRLEELAAELETRGKHRDAVPVWLQDSEGQFSTGTLGSVIAGGEQRLRYRTVILPVEAGGLTQAGTFDPKQAFQEDTAPELDVADESPGKAPRRRVRLWGGDPDDPEFKEQTRGMRRVRTLDFDPDAEERVSADDAQDVAASRRFWHWFEDPGSAEGDGSMRGRMPVQGQDHLDDAERTVTDFANRLLPQDLPEREAVILAARFHDLGKRRDVFQRELGRKPGEPWLAKSGKKSPSHRLCGHYRHEFGSLLDLNSLTEVDAEGAARFNRLSEEMKDLVRHLIAAHHGRARPHFPEEEAFDPEARGRDVTAAAAEVPRRFARLQRKYGRWQLAYLESLLRMADYAASAAPSREGEEA